MSVLISSGWVVTKYESINSNQYSDILSTISDNNMDIALLETVPKIAVYSPSGKDGYPKPIWDRETGKIDKEVAEYWKENYDLSYIMRRDWDKIGKDLEGKINIFSFSIIIKLIVLFMNSSSSNAANPPTWAVKEGSKGTFTFSKLLIKFSWEKP